jgi:hypothetical protein
MNNFKYSQYIEWFNYIYSYNKKNLLNLTLNYSIISKLIINYFNLLFKNKKNFINKIYISKPFIKYNNNKLVITIFTFNREKLSLMKNLILHSNKINKIINLLFLNKNYYFKFNREIKNFRKYLIYLYINQYKFHKNWLNLLGKFISSIYGKKVEFNIINLRYYKFNSDILTEIIANKLKDRNANIMKIIKTMLNNVKLFNNIKNNKLIYKYNNNLNFIFNNIPYKNIKGISLLVKGRLTKRYKADRSIKLRNLVGGLKSNDNNNTLSKYMFRNHIYSNINYSSFSSKRRIGSFAVKGWISGK